MNDTYTDKIINYLSSCSEPQAVETIRVKTGTSHWSAVLSHCLELMINGRIEGMKTSKSWVFWVPEEKKTTPTGGEVIVEA